MRVVEGSPGVVVRLSLDGLDAAGADPGVLGFLRRGGWGCGVAQELLDRGDDGSRLIQRRARAVQFQPRAAVHGVELTALTLVHGTGNRSVVVASLPMERRWSAPEQGVSNAQD